MKKALETTLAIGTPVMVTTTGSVYEGMIGVIGQAVGRMDGWLGISFPHTSCCDDLEEGTEIVEVAPPAELQGVSEKQINYGVDCRHNKIAATYRSVHAARKQIKSLPTDKASAVRSAIGNTLAAIHAARTQEAQAKAWIETPESEILKAYKVG